MQFRREPSAVGRAAINVSRDTVDFLGRGQGKVRHSVVLTIGMTSAFLSLGVEPTPHANHRLPTPAVARSPSPVDFS